MTRLRILPALFLLAACAPNLPQAEIPSFEVIVEDLDTPWAIDFLPDGRMIFTERPGRVSVWDGRTRTVVGELPVSEVSESGLAGIAVDPEFAENRFVYVYYTHPAVWNRVSRLVLEDNALRDETVLLDHIPSAQFHDGGRIKFGPDGMLYVTTGDAIDPASAQDAQSVAGKILRMDKDGSVPEDNPFGTLMYSLGHRNPQGLAWHPLTGELYSSEHGPQQNDEINIIRKGANYGWPDVQCTAHRGYAAPIRCFDEWTLAPAGSAFDSRGNLYVTGLRGAQLRKFVLEDGRIVNEEVVVDDLGRLRDVVHRDGWLYIATSNQDGRGQPRIGDDKIVRISVEG
jgi:glucose/arabinose dehydrogenase